MGGGYIRTMNELKMQREIIDSCRFHAGFGEKLAHKFMVGWPDLILKLHSWTQPLFVECKHQMITESRGLPIKFELKAAQHVTLERMKRTGMKTGIITGFSRGRETFIMFHGINNLQPEYEMPLEGDLRLVHRKGQRYDIRQLIGEF